MQFRFFIPFRNVETVRILATLHTNFIGDEKWRSLMQCLSKKCCQRRHRKCHEFAFPHNKFSFSQWWLHQKRKCVKSTTINVSQNCYQREIRCVRELNDDVV